MHLPKMNPENKLDDPAGCMERHVRPSHGGYVGNVIVKILCKSSQWTPGSAIMQSDSRWQSDLKQRRSDLMNGLIAEANVLAHPRRDRSMKNKLDACRRRMERLVGFDALGRWGFVQNFCRDSAETKHATLAGDSTKTRQKHCTQPSRSLGKDSTES
jgi:hypothetical protein